MFLFQILSKFPIIQHVYFGNLMSFESVKHGTSICSARLGFLHPATVTESKKQKLHTNVNDAEETTPSHSVIDVDRTDFGSSVH